MATGNREKNKRAVLMWSVWVYFKYFFWFFVDYRRIEVAYGHVNLARLAEPVIPISRRALRLSRSVVISAREPKPVPKSQLSFH
jgi:hypothetical protein